MGNRQQRVANSLQQAGGGRQLGKHTFSEMVYALVKQIPCGKVSTYKDIASALRTKAYRAVGNALNKNKDIVNIK